MLCQWLSRVVRSDYYTLTRFLFPLSFTVIVVDIGEQFLNRSLAHSANVVDVLAAFGLGFTIVKVFNGVLGEVRHAGLVLVHDRTAYRKMLLFALGAGLLVTALLIITATTQLGVWLIRDLHGVSETVSDLTRSSLVYMCGYPLFDAVSWYHGGLLLQIHASALVGAAALADIIAQIFLIAILLYTPVLCHAPIALPILAAYGGVVVRCSILLVGFYRRAYPNISRDTVTRLTVWRIISFLSPLMFTVFIQRISRPLINLIVARGSPSKTQAAEAVAVLTASYPLGHLPYGWLNTLKPVLPAFRQKKPGSNRPVIAGRKIAIFTLICLGISTVVSFVLGWIPGVSVAVLVHVVSIPRHLALLCVNPLRIFAFFCFTVSVRASLTGWLIIHQQTKLVTPSGFIRLVTIISSLFALPQIGVNGADNGVASLFSGFFMEMMAVLMGASSFLCWKRYKYTRRMRRENLLAEDSQEVEVSLTLTTPQPDGDDEETVEIAPESDDDSDLLRLAPLASTELTSECRSLSRTSTM